MMAKQNWGEGRDLVYSELGIRNHYVGGMWQDLLQAEPFFKKCGGGGGGGGGASILRVNKAFLIFENNIYL